MYKKNTLKAQTDQEANKKVIYEKMDEILGLKDSIAIKHTGINKDEEEKMNLSDNFMWTFRQRDEV